MVSVHVSVFNLRSRSGKSKEVAEEAKQGERFEGSEGIRFERGIRVQIHKATISKTIDDQRLPGEGHTYC